MLGNSMIEDKALTPAAQPQSLFERGIRMTTIRYSVIDRRTGVLSHRQAMIPTDHPILPELQWLYDETLKLAPVIRERVSAGGEANFILVDRNLRTVGCMCLDMHDLCDRDLAWLNCLLAENEEAILALVPEQMMANGAPQPPNLDISKESGSRS